MSKGLGLFVTLFGEGVKNRLPGKGDIKFPILYTLR